MGSYAELTQAVNRLLGRHAEGGVPMTRTKQLMRENNAFERALSPEFNQVLTDMVVYLRSAPVSEYNQELVRRDIGRMFLDAQRRGDSPADVIGEDYRQFCDQVLAEVPRLTVRERVLDSLSASLGMPGGMGCDLACQPRSAWDVLFRTAP